MTTNESITDSAEEVSSGKEILDSCLIISGLLDTMEMTISYMEGGWQFQTFNNLDEIRDKLKDCLTPEGFLQFQHDLEMFVKTPLRRQLGRIKALRRSITELRRYHP